MEYVLIRSRRRSASLNVKRGGEIVVRAPLYMPKLYIDQFVTKSEHWITKRRLLLSSPQSKLRLYFSIERLESYIKQQIARYSPILRVHPSKVRLTNASSYWGSCSPHDVLSFSRRLGYAPPSAVEYVVVHELCHLRHRGHGKRFWDLVKKTYPQTNEMRRVLRLIPRD